MKARNKGTNPRVIIDVTPEIWTTAKTASSSSCLVADSIKAQYPQYTGVTVDAVTVRLSDKAAGKRYTYLTPRGVTDLLLFFDQGWSYPAAHTFRLRSAIKVDEIVNTPARAARRAERKAELTARRDAGEPLTSREKHALAVMEKADENNPPRKTATGPVTEVISRREGNATVVGGTPLRRTSKHPNLLSGKDRLFGAKTAQPAQVFQEAVDLAVAERLAELGEASGGSYPTRRLAHGRIVMSAAEEIEANGRRANEFARQRGMEYLFEMPRSVPPGKVIVHNSVRPQPRLGMNGFRAWLSDINDRLEFCDCGWAPQFLEHCRVIRRA